MGTEAISYYENFSPVGDIVSIAVCFVFLVLIYNAYISKTLHFLILRHIIYTLILTAVFDILFHVLMNHIGPGGIPHIVIYILRLLFHMGLFTIMCLYIMYAKEALQLEQKVTKPFFTAMTVIFVIAFIVEILGTVFGFGFRIYPDRIVDNDIPIFLGIYVLLMSCLATMIVRYRHRVFRQVFFGIGASAVVSFMVIVIQQIHGQSSYTVAAFSLPVFALLYMLHANPYDINLGSVGEKAFEDLINISAADGRRSASLYLMSLYMHEFDEPGARYPAELQEAVREFITRFFNTPTLFQISGGHMVLVVDKKKDPDYLNGSRRMLEAFKTRYSQMLFDYKIVYTDSDERLNRDNGYVSFINYLHGKMSENTVLITDTGHVDDYMKYKYIVSQLADIDSQCDLNDPRVKVYCQPVYSIKRDTYDTAESLMRLELPDIGLVFPDIFIPIAEEFGYIQTLTRIILAKTCAGIRCLNDAGYYVKRISVNFSIYDVREDNFYSTVTGIIRNSGVEFNQVAFEITESQNEEDFELIKERINELKGSGIKFYLDDFGTGYSNFERIMELPFDIVKFDRSLVLASGNDEKFRTMVSHLAEMFDEVDYAVLYEGIEDENDEERCRAMSAKYLQGYKYSKPVPIEQLTTFFRKTTDSVEGGNKPADGKGKKMPEENRSAETLAAEKENVREESIQEEDPQEENTREETVREETVQEENARKEIAREEPTRKEPGNNAATGKKGHVCPVCGRSIFAEYGKYEICEVCGWEDDPVQLKDPDLAGGANELSLNESIRAWNDRQG
ncbi:MAG: EAL domain-containing protein [Lachnospiraceae bacterium]|nr:EAL domain-containing protein [Lachnospiraceae bacterium]